MEYAKTFLMSFWTKANPAAISTVIIAITVITLIPPNPNSRPSQNIGNRRATKNTPATTIVDECNSDDTGVGPAMASGNQVWSGNWPDLPIAATNSASAPHNNTVDEASPESAQALMACRLKPFESRLSTAH